MAAGYGTGPQPVADLLVWLALVPYNNLLWRNIRLWQAPRLHLISFAAAEAEAVAQGVKWSSTKWIHVASLDESEMEGGTCADSNPGCDGWAFAGECALGLYLKHAQPRQMLPSPAAFCRLMTMGLALVADTAHIT